jgi:hypothetical protein
MKKSMSAFFLMSLTTTISFGQEYIFGINPKINSATQLIRSSSINSAGIASKSTEQQDNLTTWGLSAFAEKKSKNHFSTILNIGYCQKGFSYPVQTLDSNSAAINYGLKLKFNYINLDLVEKVRLNKRTINPYFQVGVRFDYLLNKQFDKAIKNMNLDVYGGKAYNNYDVGFVSAIGVEIKKIAWVNFETNMDVLRPVSTNSISVRNWLWTFNLGINLYTLLN